jgi:hypothetical protein
MTIPQGGRQPAVLNNEILVQRPQYHFDVGMSDNWDKCFEWLMKTAHEFQSVFAEQMKKMSSC